MAKSNTRAEGIDCVDAAQCLMELCYSIKDLNISLDSSRSEVEVVWGQEVYSVALKELPKFIECVKYLDALNPYK